MNKQEVKALIEKSNTLTDPEGQCNIYYTMILDLEYLIGNAELFSAMDAEGNWYYLCNVAVMFNHEKGGSEFTILMTPEKLKEIISQEPA